MQEAISYTNHNPRTLTSSPPRDSLDGTDHDGQVTKSVAENAVVVFGRRGCCMSHVIRRLLQGLGVNPPVYEVDEEEEERIMGELVRINYGDNYGRGEIIRSVNEDGGVMIELPAVFVGGKLFGGLDKVMSTHISGELVPILKEARALWL